MWREAGSKGAKDKELRPRLQRVPDNMGGGCSLLCTKRSQQSIFSEGKGVILISGSKRSTCLVGNRRAEGGEKANGEVVFTAR